MELIQIGWATLYSRFRSTSSFWPDCETRAQREKFRGGLSSLPVAAGRPTGPPDHGLPQALQTRPRTTRAAHRGRTGAACRQSKPRKRSIIPDADPAATRLPIERRRQSFDCPGSCHAAVRRRLGEEVLAELTLRSLAPGGVPAGSPSPRATLDGARADCATRRRPPQRPPRFARSTGLTAGAIWVPRIGLGPAFRCFRGNQGRQEPRPDPGYFGCDRT